MRALLYFAVVAGDSNLSSAARKQALPTQQDKKPNPLPATKLKRPPESNPEGRFAFEPAAIDLSHHQHAKTAANHQDNKHKPWLKKTCLNKTKTARQAPAGGLFAFVSSPHNEIADRYTNRKVQSRRSRYKTNLYSAGFRTYPARIWHRDGCGVSSCASAGRCRRGRGGISVNAESGDKLILSGRIAEMSTGRIGPVCQ
ncbi:hypothetical protein [Mesorhizobium sp. M8A.F.Ca.ET.165.01.1.1]|uniref:hypothetical protein n=1 Tax=Mesorhizobium sp. M8A.F.Ca.ET.165.01.1.1 TaxID=2563960 RepID=UPI0010938BDB|nr:hypothetical protein [Mesorhizobium sp. M8A.F.Ca.ET.165.01.1.1]